MEHSGTFNQEKATIDKMITFIYFEAKEKINELKIKALEDYNTEKSKLIKEATDQEEIKLKKQTDEIRINRLKKLSDVKMKYKLKLSEKKLEKINEIFKKSEQRLKNVRLSHNLIKESLNNIEGNNLIAYVLPNDKERIKNYDNSRISQVYDLDVSFLGGIILTNEDESVIVDNSFFKRLETIRIKGMPMISKKLFNGE
ncbi:vacuolar atp synthase subunit e [Pseudoloma neurophilia]|uniref:Vacuolar atp synthase subunit e n=1 Tax=Pseudoloma neurophilia TaxID=146866 RepID=A0A0R0LX14_9MICR|nr:vacuolar atp synthase subunit e [Pseudoloma neurophilia]